MLLLVERVFLPEKICWKQSEVYQNSIKKLSWMGKGATGKILYKSHQILVGYSKILGQNRIIALLGFFFFFSNCTQQWKAPSLNGIASRWRLNASLSSFSSSFFKYLSALLIFLICLQWARWPYQWMVYWPPQDTPRRITPCWVLMTSSTSEGAPTRPTCQDHPSATISWDVSKT